MSLLEILSFAVLGVLIALGVALVVVVIRHSSRTHAGDLVGLGNFQEALEISDISEDADRDQLFAAAVAAKHVMELDLAEQLVNRILEEDESDGEAWLERGLIHAYLGRYDSSLESLSQAARLRADLLESISLHRSWIDLKRGEIAAARRRFEEVSAPLESKLVHDIGPGDPLFSEWFFQAADLWEENGAEDKSTWAREEARRSAAESLLVAKFG